MDKKVSDSDHESMKPSGSRNKTPVEMAVDILNGKQGQRLKVFGQRTASAAGVRPLPTRLFKYLPRRYAESLVEIGNTRIGTLHGFRSVELGPGIADPDEGKKELRASFDAPETFVNGEASGRALEQLGMFKLEGGGSVTFSDLSLVVPVESPDCYIWCASGTRSRAAMASLDGAETCVEIFDPLGFFHELHLALASGHGILHQHISRVTYAARVEEWNRTHSGLHPALLKGAEFATQDEVRSIWVPTGITNALDPVIIQESDIGRYCRIVEMA